MNRRSFLKTAGIGLGVFAVLPNTGIIWAGIPSRQGSLIKGRKLNIACVGIGGRGAQNVKGVSDENIVALCDVQLGDEQNKTIAQHPNAKVYRDYRKMLLEMDKNIDAVVVATPDHMHFPIASMAMQMGKHVYVEKPIAHTVEEARKMTLLAREKQVITQCGNQGHAGNGIRNFVEWIRAGAIGDVHEVHVWTNRPLKSGAYKWDQGITLPTEKIPVPDDLKWNLWLGVAPFHDYNPAYMPKKWRGWWDFGSCALGDMGCHMLDGPFWALDLKYPESVDVDQKGATKDSGPLESTITYSFPARGKMPPVKVFWYDGGRKPPRPEGLEPEREFNYKGGMYMVGDKGVIMDTSTTCRSPRLIPETKMKEFMHNKPAQSIPRIPKGDQWKEWINACKGEGPKPGSNFDYSGPLSEMVLMGNLAVRSNKKVEWDAENMICINPKYANQYVRTTYRKF